MYLPSKYGVIAMLAAFLVPLLFIFIMLELIKNKQTSKPLNHCAGNIKEKIE